MSRRILASAVLLSGLTMAVPLSAQGVNTTGTWSDVTVPSNSGVSFWDHRSLDGRACNIGYFLLYKAGSGFGACNNQRPTDAFVESNAGRLGTNSDGLPNGSYLSHVNYSFKPGQYRLDFLGSLAAYGPGGPLPQQLGVFTNGANGPVFQQALYAVGSYPNALTTRFDVYMNEEWFLGAHHVQSTNLWDFTTDTGPDHGWSLFSSRSASDNPGGDRDVMFASFGDVEAGDQDYNDLIVQISAVPEPESVVMFGAGFAVLAILACRRQRGLSI